MRLSSKRSEASGLLVVESPEALSKLGASGAWWICHDEGDLDEMLSLVVADNDEWRLEPVGFGRQEDQRTDAEALARLGDAVFVFGSSFVDKSGSFDHRRAFVGRFSESAALAGAPAVDVLDLGSTLADLAAAALAGIDLLRTDGAPDLVNVEGAGFVDDDLFLGFRWPVSAEGQPLLLRISDAAAVFGAPDWSAARIASLDASAVVVDVGASPKRPAGVRGMTVVDGAVQLVVGQTERRLAAKKVKAAGARHVRVDTLGPGPSSGIDIEHFEGFRKVEGVAPAPDGRWVYALDDEDAVVLVVSAEA